MSAAEQVGHPAHEDYYQVLFMRGQLISSLLDRMRSLQALSPPLQETGVSACRKRLKCTLLTKVNECWWWGHSYI